MPPYSTNNHIFKSGGTSGQPWTGGWAAMLPSGWDTASRGIVQAPFAKNLTFGAPMATGPATPSAPAMTGTFDAMAAASGMMSIAAGVMGLIVGKKQAKAQRETLRQAAILEQVNINAEILNARITEAIQVDELSRETQVALGQIRVASPDGLAHAEAMASSLTRSFAGRENIRMQLETLRESAKARKHAIIEAAKYGAPSETLGAISGALSGLQMGQGFSAAMGQYKSTSEASPLLQQLADARLSSAQAQTGVARAQTRAAEAEFLTLEGRYNRMSGLVDNYYAQQRSILQQSMPIFGSTFPF